MVMIIVNGFWFQEKSSIIIIIIIIGELVEKMPKPSNSAVPSMQLSTSNEDITNACHFTT